MIWLNVAPFFWTSSPLFNSVLYPCVSTNLTGSPKIALFDAASGSAEICVNKHRTSPGGGGSRPSDLEDLRATVVMVTLTHAQAQEDKNIEKCSIFALSLKGCKGGWLNLIDNIWKPLLSSIGQYIVLSIFTTGFHHGQPFKCQGAVGPANAETLGQVPGRVSWGTHGIWVIGALFALRDLVVRATHRLFGMVLGQQS